MQQPFPRIIELYRYPFKGLTPERLDRAQLSAGQGVPLDRRFALAHGDTAFNPEQPEHFSKTHYLMLMKNERLAALRSEYDAESGVLYLYEKDEDDDEVLAISGDLNSVAGRHSLETFFQEYLGEEIRGLPKIVQASDKPENEGHMFSDVPNRVVSIINLASLRELEQAMGTSNIDPLRFRANIYVDGLPAWEEHEWSGQRFQLGGVHFRGLKPTQRCAATNVNPKTAERDLSIPSALVKNFGHPNLGLYAEVLNEGEIKVGDMLFPPRD